MNYMAKSIPQGEDFRSEIFESFLKEIDHPYMLHRKLWEWAFIFHHLEAAGKLAPGCRGVGFGVGREKLPSAMAARGCTVVATDAPAEIAPLWNGSGQHSDNLDILFYEKLVDKEVFYREVSFQECDMTAIPDSMRDFDFCWSACCFEHLGSIDAGFDFVANSLRTLKPGGVAVHTTEFNLSSDDKTVDSGATVLYRRQDIARFVKAMTDAGHIVSPIRIEPGSMPVDSHVDVPPYAHDPHLKLALLGHITTSIGLVIQKGA